MESVHWNGGRSLAESFSSRGERLLLLPTRGEPGRFSLDVRLAGEGRAGAPLAAGSPFEVLAATVGIYAALLGTGWMIFESTGKGVCSLALAVLLLAWVVRSKPAS